jgi:D-sedoheptulose 7-phosphate isomerase
MSKNSSCLNEIDQLIETLTLFKDLSPVVEEIGGLIQKCLVQGKKILTAGNGGSAADALHFSEELLGRFDKDRPPLPAICLVADPTLITCISNDYGFENIFSRQVSGLAQNGDVLVVFTSSGNSINLVNAIKTGREKGAITIALLGKDGGLAKGKADYEIIVPSKSTARVQEVHTFILHCWLKDIESRMGWS